MKRILIGLAATLMAASGALAQDVDPGQRPALLNDLLACRAETGAEARLACYDAAAAAFDTAERQGEVTVIDQTQARETRARLFGLDLDTVNLFGGLRNDAPVEAIETTLVSASQDHRDQWTFVLSDGSTWKQIDRERVSTRVAPGATIRIRAAAMGSYLLSVNGARSVRARRER